MAAGSFVWPCRLALCGLGGGVRVNLENSTACQKSMPSFTSFRGDGELTFRVGELSSRSDYPLVDNDQTAKLLVVLAQSGFQTTFVGIVFLSFPFWGWGESYINGEFDPGSGRTLAACLTHASRTVILGACFQVSSGERVSNT